MVCGTSPVPPLAIGGSDPEEGQVGGYKVGNKQPALNQGLGSEERTRAKEGPHSRMELESSLDMASSHVQLCRVFTVQQHQAEGQVWVGSSLWATP